MLNPFYFFLNDYLLEKQLLWEMSGVRGVFHAPLNGCNSWAGPSQRQAPAWPSWCPTVMAGFPGLGASRAALLGALAGTWIGSGAAGLELTSVRMKCWHN